MSGWAGQVFVGVCTWRWRWWRKEDKEEEEDEKDMEDEKAQACPTSLSAP